MRKGRNDYLRGKAETARSAFSIGCHFLSSLFSLLPQDNFNPAAQSITNQTDAAGRARLDARPASDRHRLSTAKRRERT